MSVWSVVLAGGIGSRFWPLSTPRRPKQLLPLVDQRPLLVGTLDRLAPLTPADHTLVLTNASLVSATSALLPRLPNDNIIAEPRPAGTAAALAWAASEIQRRDGPDAIMLSVHADWAIRDEAGFRNALARAGQMAAKHASLVTVGVVPERPDPGLGYICPGDVIEGDVRRVARFVEKPDRERAASMVSEGCLWNSGIFAWRVGDFLAEVRALTPEVAPALVAAAGDRESFFSQVQSVSVDVGVLERSGTVVVIPGTFGWDDIGTWAALARVRALDRQGNAVYGRVHAVESTDNVVHAEHGTVVLFGVTDLVVVVRDGLTLVTSVDGAAGLKTLVDALPPSVRELP
jgi:mannose-1-phosphate guanylyltransferase